MTKRYLIKAASEPISFGKATPFPYHFLIVDKAGKQIKYFETGRGKTFYTAIIRDDLQYYRHLHVKENHRSGIFTIPKLIFPDFGKYRLFADFIPLDTDLAGLPHATATVDFLLPGQSEPKLLGSHERVQNFDIYEVTLETVPDPPRVGPVKFLFHVSVDNKVVTDFEDHLGSAGHLMIFRRSTLDYEHAVARDDSGTNTLPALEFSATLPRPGVYKLFLEFRHREKTTTGDFLVKAAE